MDPKELPTRELLDCCLQTNGDAAWAEFVERIRPTIQGVIYKRLCRRGAPDPGLIQDLTNATFVKLLPALPRFQWQGEGQFFGWVKQTTLSAVGDWVRKLKPEDADGEALNTVEDRRFSEEQVLVSLRCKEIEQRLKGTNATEREIDIFWFYYRYGYTAREIANMPAVNLTEKRVETILARLVRQLRRETLGASAGE
jgi:RNA polymerase sigma-70 factor (ECF subfamily)